MSWRDLHIHDESQSFRVDVVTNEFSNREYTGQCLDKNGRLLVFERAVSYSGDVDGMTLEAFPDALAAAPYSFSLVCADGRKYKKAVAQAQYEELCGRLIDEMRREAKYQKTLAKQWSQQEYALFAAIRRGDLQAVQTMREAEPALVNAIAPKNPVDSTYMSPLQVALSAGWIRQVNWHTWINWKKDIAWYLLKRGADVNYRPAYTYGKIDEPVLHSAFVNATWNLPRSYLRRNVQSGEALGVWHEIHTVQESEDAFAFLKAMIERGADPNFLAYDGRTALFKAVGGCSFAYSNTDEKTPELEAHIRRMIELLITAGADITNASRVSKKTILETYRDTPGWALIGGYF